MSVKSWNLSLFLSSRKFDLVRKIVQTFFLKSHRLSRTETQNVPKCFEIFSILKHLLDDKSREKMTKLIFEKSIRIPHVGIFQFSPISYVQRIIPAP